MNNSKKALSNELKTKFYVGAVLEKYDISKEKIIKKYREKRRTKDIGNYALEYIEGLLKKDCDFLGRINYLYENKHKCADIGEIIYYTDKKEYREDIDESYDCGRPISRKVIKNKDKDLDIQRERSL